MILGFLYVSNTRTPRNIGQFKGRARKYIQNISKLSQGVNILMRRMIRNGMATNKINSKAEDFC